MSSIVQDAVEGLGKGEGPIDERPLTDEERKTVARLLSDPFAFPQTFKTWLVSFLESSDLTLPISSIVGLGSTLGIGGGGNTSFIAGLMPAGTILGWGSSRIPNGCLRCNGVAYSRVAYPRLFNEIGTQWGAGDGVNTFNIPDLRRRFPLGVGDTYFGLTHNDGRSEDARSPDHHHYFQDTKGVNGNIHGGGGHSHTYDQAFGVALKMVNNADSPANTVGINPGSGTGWAGDHGHGFDGWVTIAADTTGGYDQDHPSFVAIHFVITT